MLNQTSFRLTTTLRPDDVTWKVTEVINKKDGSWHTFYPSFTNETVVLTNESWTMIETTKASCNGSWNITFLKRGLKDDDTEETYTNRKLQRNPWTLCFVTVWAADFVTRAEYEDLEARVSALEWN